MQSGVASYPGVLPRLLLAVAALAVAALLTSSLRDHDACQDARADVIAAATGTAVAPAQRDAIRRIRDHCRGAQSLVSASAVLYAQGLADEAQALAQEAVDAEPENATAWNALATTAAEGDPATARRAAERLARLSPLDRPAEGESEGAGP